MAYRISTEQGISDYFFTSRRSNPSSAPHVHSHIEFIYVLAGSLSLNIDDAPYTLDQDTMAVIMPYQIHGYTSNTDSDIFIIACPPEYIAEYKQLFADKLFSPCVTAFNSVIRQTIGQIASLDAQNPFLYKSLIYYSLSQYLTGCDLRKREFLEYDVYRKAIVYISEHYAEKLTLEVVARYVDVTPVHLSRVLNSHGQNSFSDIVNSIRIFEAKILLERTSRPISEIAYDCGYGSLRNFNRIFQKFFGCSPRDVRNARA